MMKMRKQNFVSLCQLNDYNLVLLSVAEYAGHGNYIRFSKEILRVPLRKTVLVCHSTRT